MSVATRLLYSPTKTTDCMRVARRGHMVTWLTWPTLVRFRRAWARGSALPFNYGSSMSKGWSMSANMALMCSGCDINRQPKDFPPTTFSSVLGL